MTSTKRKTIIIKFDLFRERQKCRKYKVLSKLSKHHEDGERKIPVSVIAHQ